MADRGYDLFARPSRRALSVSQLTREVKGLLEGRFASVEVEGEVFNVSRNAATGHTWFTLRDRSASLKCVLFRSSAQRLKFAPANGVRSVARGRITVYEQGGDYQLIVDSLAPIGAGELTLRFEELKKKLQAEGLFDASLKRPLPHVPRRIGLVTSATGAAVADFLHVAGRRWPGIPVLIAPARVQGEGAASEICRSLARLSAVDGVDVIVVARGGGSIEDLWAFNEEAVARAVRRCPVPVVSGVGHETDFTIADFAADVRAPTPSAAAELVVPVRAELLRQLNVSKRRLWHALRRHMDVRRHQLENRRKSLADPRRIIGERRIALDRQVAGAERTLAESLKQRRIHLEALNERLQRAHPRAKLATQAQLLRALEARNERAIAERLRMEKARQERFRTRIDARHPRSLLSALRRTLDARSEQLKRAGRERLTTEGRTLGELAGRLDAMSPLKVLSRGYSLVYVEGRLVRRASSLAAGDKVRVRVSQGAFDARVESVDDES